jgi:hypothetical protein
MLHDDADETLHNKAQKELLEENLKQILLTVQNLYRQRCHAENPHQNHQNDQRNNHHQFHHHPHGTQQQTSWEGAYRTIVLSVMLLTDLAIFADYPKMRIGVNQTSLKAKKKPN